MEKFYFLVILVVVSSNAFAIEVGGHITEDTTWGPVNNPYEVVENLFVDSGATLTIQPGTEIKVTSAILTELDDWYESFPYFGGINEARLFWINGSIIAEGTEQDSIIFTRLSDDPDHFWGSIYIPENAEGYRFKHCRIEYTGGNSIYTGRVAWGALSIYQGSGSFSKLLFYNNNCGFQTNNDSGPFEIINNRFIQDEYLNAFVSGFHDLQIETTTPLLGQKPPLIANNYFSGSFRMFFSAVIFTNNIIKNNDYESIYLHDTDGYIGYYYENQFMNCHKALRSSCIDSHIYIRKNEFIDTVTAIDFGWNDNNYVEIRENGFYNSAVVIDSGNSGRVFNNYVDGGVLVIDDPDMEVHNNITINSTNGLYVYLNYNIYNNMNINSHYAICNNAISYTNCILVNNVFPYHQSMISENPVLRNCMVDFPIEYPLIDGGGNIIVDSLQVQQSLFMDFQNGDFHHGHGSIAIDAGFDTLGYNYPFDFDFNHRIWDGDYNGSAIIDIGPYEYGAPALGGIQGITYNPAGGEFVDYVLIKIDNLPGEFTFSDSIGNFEYKLPAGVYDVYAERVFYEDAVEYQIEVFDGEFTLLDIPMYETVDANEPVIPNPSSSIINLNNYPNPFNPTTTISFSIQNDDSVELSIFNIKGQKIKSLFNEQMQKGKHSIIWSGTDENNKTVCSGIYLYKIKVSNQESVKRMLLLK